MIGNEKSGGDVRVGGGHGLQRGLPAARRRIEDINVTGPQFLIVRVRSP